MNNVSNKKSKEEDKDLDLKEQKIDYKKQIANNLKQISDKIENLKKKLRLEQKNLKLWNSLVDFYTILDLLKKESTKLFSKLQLDEDDYYRSFQVYLEGYKAYQEGEFDKAKTNFLESIKILENNLIAYYTLGNLYFIHKHYDDAENAYKEGLKHCKGSNLELLSNLGMTKFKKGDINEAERCFLDAIDVDENTSYVLNNLGLLNEWREQFDVAIDFYKKAILSNPKDGDIWYNLGNLLGKLGNKEGRLYCFIKAEDLGFKELKEMIDDLLDQGVKLKDPFSIEEDDS